MRSGAELTDAEVADVLREMAVARAPATLCPSEVARALAKDWRPLMGRVREVAGSMPEIVAMRGGVAVDAVAAKGPIRLGLR